MYSWHNEDLPDCKIVWPCYSLVHYKVYVTVYINVHVCLYLAAQYAYSTVYIGMVVVVHNTKVVLFLHRDTNGEKSHLQESMAACIQCMQVF